MAKNVDWRKMKAEYASDLTASHRSLAEKYGDTDPLAVSFTEFLTNCKIPPSEGRHSWDPAAAIYAVEGCREFLNESERGNITLPDEGVTYFTPDENGNITVLTNRLMENETEADSKARMAKYIDTCAEQIILKSVNRNYPHNERR